MPVNYDNSAWFYDQLSSLIFGKAIFKAQVYLLQFVEAGNRVLIVGGGTGWILEELTRVHPSGLEITYVEVSAKMMAQSKKRNIGLNKVFFINDAVENVDLKIDFDVIYTPFLFDNFTEQTLQHVFNHLHSSLKKKGIWLNCDFQLTGKWWQRVLLKSMLLFFKLLCDVEAYRLPDTRAKFFQLGYQSLSLKTFFGDFIASTVYIS